MALLDGRTVNTTPNLGNKFAVADWDSYIGQERAKRLIRLRIDGAKERNELMGNLLILGPSGAGKSALATLAAQEHGEELLEIMMSPNISMSHVLKIITDFDMDKEIWDEDEDGNLPDEPTIKRGGGIVFIDEIHLASKRQQHSFYSMLQDKYIAYDNGKKYHFKNPITFIAATTDENLLNPSLRQRLGQPIRLEDYTDLEMAQITERMFHALNIAPTERQCVILGRASAGSPRRASGLVEMARDLGTDDPFEVLREARVTPEGLTEDHLAYLNSLRNLGGVAGLENIASHSMRAKSDVLEMEKFLVNRRFIEVGRGGRKMTVQGEKALRKAEKVLS